MTPAERLAQGLDDAVRLVEGARAVPMSSSAVVPREELLALLDELRELVPQALAGAREVLGERDAVVEQGRREADRLVQEARQRADALLARDEVHRRAVQDAERLLQDAQDRTATMQVQVDDYVDGKLANFEVVLHKTLEAVRRGRAKLAGRSDLDDLGVDPDDGDGPLPR